MKKFTLFLKGVSVSKNQFYVWCLLALCLQSSCKTMNTATLEASVDGTKQKFSGPSYPHSSDSNLEPGENLGLMIIAGMSHGESGADSYNNRHSGFYNPLYASADKGPGSFLNPNGSLAASKSNNFTDRLYFMGGLEFVNKGIDGGGSLAYFQVPLYAMYQYKLDGNAGKVFGGLGPYFSYGVIGSAFSGDDGFKRFDAGLGLTAGYELPQSLYFRLGFDIGLANIQRNAFGDKVHNSTISLSVGYPLNKLIGTGK